MNSIFIRVAKIVITISALWFAPTAFAQQTINHNCGSCTPSIDWEALLEIKSILNARPDINQWREGDKVKITNSSGDSATWTFLRNGNWVMTASSSGPSGGGGGGGIGPYEPPSFPGFGDNTVCGGGPSYSEIHDFKTVIKCGPAPGGG